MWTNKIGLSCPKTGYPQYPQPLLLLRKQLATAADLNRLGPHLWKACGPLIGRPKRREPNSLFQVALTALPALSPFQPADRPTWGTLEPPRHADDSQPVGRPRHDGTLVPTSSR